MKRKTAEKAVIRKPEKDGNILTAQTIGNLVIIGAFKNRILLGRQCINADTLEYAQYNEAEKTWSRKKLCRLYGVRAERAYWGLRDLKINTDTQEDEQTIMQLPIRWRTNNVLDMIQYAEEEYMQKQYQAKERRKAEKIRDVMDLVPDLPENIEDWIDEVETGHQEYILHMKPEGEWYCTACQTGFKFKELKGERKKLLNGDEIICPNCGKKVTVKKRKSMVEVITHIALLQTINSEMSVARHFDVTIFWKAGQKKEIALDESMRIIMHKGLPVMAGQKKACTIYYNQYRWCYGNEFGYDNPANRRTFAGHLYPTGIEEALNRTSYQKCSRLFMGMQGQVLNWNRIMANAYNDRMLGLAELLYRGRFYKLLRESVEEMDYFGYNYQFLDIGADTIEGTFRIKDRQLINRIRDKNGGKSMVAWFRWADNNKKKISEKALSYIIANNLNYRELERMLKYMSLEQAVNYIEKQRQGPYKKIGRVLSQYEDYMRMCEELHKHMDDEMVYKPRELKRRHDEAVMELEERRAQIKAEEYSRKYGEAEEILQEIKEKFEYASNDFLIRVPEKIVDIVTEGRYLHHCAGATDRYFDRIKQRETYICFLRKTETPDMPFYTIEVEPGGTIRQHRGMFDEEPELDNVKPFLKEWQQVIRERMSEEDMRLAQRSAEKREENLEDLRKKNNLRVLKGLMEDFMEAV